MKKRREWGGERDKGCGECTGMKREQEGKKGKEITELSPD